MATIEYTLRLQEAQWDFGTGVGLQNVMCFHQYIDSTGIVLDHNLGGGSWEPFIPGPVIRGNVNDVVKVTIQNRISDPSNHFINALKTDTIIHWHGIELANTYDGTPVTQKPIATGTDFTYVFELHRPGVFWYHPHWNSMVQTQLGAYGTIIVEDDITDELRDLKIIPHEDRTFNITLSDISFQNDREVEELNAINDPTPGNYVPLTDITTVSPVFIRDILHLGGANDQNVGDVLLINGKHQIPFNDSAGNFQQFWPDGQRGNLNPEITAHEDESMAFQIVNSGMHRFYKVHLAFRTTTGGAWTRSDNLFRLGGEGGLLDQARAGGGEFGNFKLNGWKNRDSGAGLKIAQPTSEFTPGEFLIPTSSRTWVAFKVEPGWVEVALRVNGYSVNGNINFTADEDPSDMIIAKFDVDTTTDNTYKLPADIDATTLLRKNTSLVLNSPDPLEDLSSLTAVTSFASCNNAIDINNELMTNGVIVPIDPILPDYEIKLNQNSGPAINSFKPVWNDQGPFQPTEGNTLYVNKGDVVEWTVETETFFTDHPWHLHGFSFQPIKMELKNVGPGYTPLYTWDFVEYVDSIYVPFAHKLTFRFKVEDRPYFAEDFTSHTDGVIGRWLAHCHIFKHAHKGMMMNFVVVDSCAINNYQFTDVYLRDHPTDDGTEPFPGGFISASPDIILLQNTVTNGQASFGQSSGTENDANLGNIAEFGQDNYIYVRANNRGSQVGIVKTDVYWSEPSTLADPTQWNYIGETNAVTVNPNFLTVADPLTWPSAGIPATGHYCFIGVAGSINDPKPISTTGAANWSTVMVWNDFLDLIKNYNNIVWRNFDVVNINPSAGLFVREFDFKFRGAFDGEREFDVVFVNPLVNTELLLPNDDQILDQLKQNELEFKAREKDILVTMRPKSELRLSNLKLAKDKDYRSKLVVQGKPEELIGQQFIVKQEYINEFEGELKAVANQIMMIHTDLHHAKHHKMEKQIDQLTRKMKGLELQKKEIEKRASAKNMEDRIEVGRVTWSFVEDRTPKCSTWPWWIKWLCQLWEWIKKLLGFNRKL